MSVLQHERPADAARLRNRRKQEAYRKRWLVSREVWERFLQNLTLATEEGQRSRLTLRLSDFPNEALDELSERLVGKRLIFCKTRRKQPLVSEGGEP